MMEMELKLMVPPECRAAVLESLELAAVPPLPLRAHYFDTPEGDLSAKGVSIRLRREGKAWVQTVKAGGDSPVRRQEHNVALAARVKRPNLDLALHEASHAGRRLNKVLKAAEAQEALTEAYSTEVIRRARQISAFGESLEIAFDEGVLQAAGQQRPISEVELEVTSGTTFTQLFSLAKTLVAEHGLWLSTLSKSSRGEALARPGKALPVQRAGRVKVNPEADGPTQMRAMVRHCLDQILPNASHVAAGSIDADQIHQLRVGIRRLRTLLRELGALSPAVKAQWEEPLAVAFRALGAFRDRQAVQEAVGARLASAGAPAVAPAADDHPAVQEPGASVRDKAFQWVLIDLLEFALSDGSASGGMGSKAARQLIRKRLKKLHSKVAAEGKQFTTLPAEQQHQIRKRLKRLRYLSEFAAPVFGQHAVERYLARLRPAQDALGEHNDDAVALEVFRHRAESDGHAWFAVGWLTARQEQTARQCARALQKIEGLEPFWD